MSEFADDMDEYDQTVAICKPCLCQTMSMTVRAATCLTVLSNYAQLMKLWEIRLQETLTREVRSLNSFATPIFLKKYFYLTTIFQKIYKKIVRQLLKVKELPNRLWKHCKICVQMRHLICFMNLFQSKHQRTNSFWTQLYLQFCSWYLRILQSFSGASIYQK